MKIRHGNILVVFLISFILAPVERSVFAMHSSGSANFQNREYPWEQTFVASVFYVACLRMLYQRAFTRQTERVRTVTHAGLEWRTVGRVAYQNVQNILQNNPGWRFPTAEEVRAYYLAHSSSLPERRYWLADQHVIDFDNPYRGGQDPCRVVNGDANVLLVRSV